MTTIGRTLDDHPVTLDAAKLVTTRMLVQANSGGGKSWMLRVLCERIGCSVPIIVLDWEGEFASLREKLDVLLVGRDGELPTAVATAGALASQVLEIGVSAVIDLYDLNPGEKRAYVRRFLESLMAAPKRLWGPRLVVVDEAHNLCPEDGQYESSGPVCDLATAGRKRQFCAVLATQRLSKLSKDAAAELNNVLIGRCTLDVDQKRAGDILGMARVDFTRLRELEAGQFHGFGPAFNHRGVFLFKSADVETTHGSIGSGTAKPPEPSARMRRAVEQLRDLAERSKTEVLDLDSARATIRDLRKQVAAAQLAPSGPSPEERARLDEISAMLREASEKHAAADRSLRFNVAAISEIKAIIDRTVGQEAPPIYAPLPARLMNRHAKRPPPSPRHVRRDPRPTTDGITPRQQRFLDAAASLLSLNTEATRETVCAWVGVHPRGGSVGEELSAMEAAGLIRVDRGRVEVTEAGMAAAGHVDQGEALDRAKASLSNRQRRIFEIVCGVYPATISRESVAEQMEIHPRGGSFGEDIARLVGRGLIESGRGEMRARDFLFAGGPT